MAAGTAISGKQKNTKRWLDCAAGLQKPRRCM
jgi:hypothetical protein